MRYRQDITYSDKYCLGGVYWSEGGVLVLNLLFLLVTSILLAVGMVLLPPLTGTGLGSIVTRAWLVLGLLVFFGYYSYYLAQGERSSRQRKAAKPKAHLRSVQSGARSAGYK